MDVAGFQNIGIIAHLQGQGGILLHQQEGEPTLFIEIDEARNLILVKGSVPGHKNSFIIIKEARKRPKGFVKQKAAQVVSKKSAKAQGQAKK